MAEEQTEWMDNLWISIDDDVVTIGINEDAAEELSDGLSLNLPQEDDSIMPGKVCGDVSSANGNVNIYTPVAGVVVEVNEAILDNPNLIVEDPLDEGWLMRVEAENTEDLENITDDEDVSDDVIHDEEDEE